MKSKRAFTLVEIVLVTVVLLLVSALIVPHIVNIAKARELREFKARLTLFVIEGRQRAIEDSHIVSMKYDDVQNHLYLSVQQTDDVIAQEEVLDTLNLAEGVTPTRFSINGTESNVGEWQIDFFPDSTSDRGNLEFTLEGQAFYLSISKIGGKSEVIEGAMNDPGDDQWEAGTFEQRL